MVRVEALIKTKIVVKKQSVACFVLHCGTGFGIAKQDICALHHEFLQGKGLFRIVKFWTGLTSEARDTHGMVAE
ncbi:hypothetical protein [Burkholderia sp. F1]|uniref:hypothetical protein n=1 Tax=Burkholderia sp. F1 TaxID=3366817 RepID=UPI003D71C7FF